MVDKNGDEKYFTTIIRHGLMVMLKPPFAWICGRVPIQPVQFDNATKKEMALPSWEERKQKICFCCRLYYMMDQSVYNAFTTNHLGGSQ